MKLIKQTLISVIRFLGLGFTSLKLKKDRLGNLYQIERAGRYAIFRETINTKIPREEPTVLVVGFRLKWIKSSGFLHWLFQRCCILTTTFWGGFSGFKVKLWMVDSETKNYLGIYQWYGERNAQTYVDFLTPILNFFSVKNSVWRRLHSNVELNNYLTFREAQNE